MKRPGLLFALLLAGIVSLSPVRAETLRVGLFRLSPPPAVEISGSGIVESSGARGRFRGTVSVCAAEGDISARLPSGLRIAGGVLRFLPEQVQAPLALQGRHYRGSFIVSSQSGKLVVVNQVDLEDYLRGVVPNEMFRGLESFRVQAVISRTFALYIKQVERRHAKEGFDICDGCCQVYKGLDSEDPLANQAVESTQGEVLLFRGKPILAAFDANAGGRTCTVDEAWPGSLPEKFPYLRSLASPDDSAALKLAGFESSYRWSISFRWEELLARLGASAEEFGALLGVDLSIGPSGRVTTLAFRGTGDRLVVRSPEAIRRAFGLLSARFEIRYQDDRFVFTGSGNGHGVGLSQHGAYGMAQRGLDHRQILAYYYPGATLTGLRAAVLP